MEKSYNISQCKKVRFSFNSSQQLLLDVVIDGMKISVRTRLLDGETFHIKPNKHTRKHEKIVQKLELVSSHALMSYHISNVFSR